MQSVKFSLAGEYWDSQIYSGILYLFDEKCALHRVDWSALIDSVAQNNQNIQTAIRVAFSDSDLFYNPKVKKILRDPSIEGPIKKQLAELSKLEMSESLETIGAHVKSGNSPFDFLPIDTDIYYHHIFAGGDEGLYSSQGTAGNEGRHFRATAQKHHDARFFQIKASDRFTAIAAAVGNDGLFEFNFDKDSEDVLGQEKILAKRACSACDWAFQSVMGWTTDSAFLASFKKDRDPHSKFLSRSFDRIVESSEMFFDDPLAVNKSGITWGSREKIYKISDDGLTVVDYSPDALNHKKSQKNQKPVQLYKKRSTEKMSFNSKGIVSTGTAPFGTVLEFDDRITVIRSDSVVDSFPGEAVHWRIFPRSEHYSNQLHIIYEDRIDVISFVHDYFVDQNEKLYGFSRG
ncbi:MAG: hypothetical protein CFE38_06380 [Comamonadaceae bacterium PBBC1]|nr:MAG: hypothetical protein CFE38_06380 [Comamonadaceae bacterium PBBC1]